MFRSFILFLLLILSSLDSFSQNESFSKELVWTQFMESMDVKVKHNKREIIVMPHLRAAPSDNILAGLINTQLHFFQYLLDNYSRQGNNKIECDIGKVKKCKQVYLDSMNSDSAFKEYIFILSSWYFKTKNKSITNFTRPEKSKIPFDDFLDISAHLFYVSGFNEDGTIILSIVDTKINGIHELQVNDYVEAFCYSVIRQNTKNALYPFSVQVEQLKNSINEELKNSNSPRDEKKLIEIRQRIYAEMEGNVFISKLLLDAYMALNPYLPFEIQNN